VVKGDEAREVLVGDGATVVLLAVVLREGRATMKSDVQGCSTCPAGEEMWEEWSAQAHGRVADGDVKSGLKMVMRVQYDYRTTEGELFSCVAESIDEARARRNEWLKQRSRETRDALMGTLRARLKEGGHDA